MTAQRKKTAQKDPNNMNTRERRLKRQEENLTRVLDEVVEADNEILKSVLKEKGVNSLGVLFSEPFSVFQDMRYDDEDGEQVALPMWSLNAIRTLRAWNKFLLAHSESTVDWGNPEIINQEEYTKYRDEIYSTALNDSTDEKGNNLVNNGLLSNPINNNNPGFNFNYGCNSDSVDSLAREFRRSIKLDKTHYTVIQDDKDFFHWKRLTESTACSHKCENVLRPNYMPKTKQEGLLFQEQNNFIYDVFLTTIQTNMGIHYVRTFERNRDAQSVWTSYCKYTQHSSKSELRVNKIMKDLTLAKLDSSFKGSTQDFILE